MVAVLHYFLILIPMLLIDVCWLFFAGPSFYKPLLDHLMASSMSIYPAVLFYALYALGILILIINPGRQLGMSAVEIVARGAFLGLVAYGAYDLTNQATLRDWPVVVTIVDMAWGACVTALSTAIGLMLIRYFNR